MSAPDLWIDGAPATIEDLTHQALVNYGAYTSFVVTNGGVRGLDRHLIRLRSSALELFGETLDDGAMRSAIRQALGERANAFVRVSLFSREIGARRPDYRGEPSVMVAVFPPVPALATEPMRLQVQTYVREASHLKHLATFGLVRARRKAHAAGFDDALFADAAGRISEGSLWNIGFLKGETAIWPDAPMLPGVSQAVLSDHLAEVGLEQERRPVDVSDLPAFDGAFITNSTTPVCMVAAIDGRDFCPIPDVAERLTRAWSLAEPQPL